MSSFFEHGAIRLGYEIIGNGQKVMLAFHGFGNTADMFRVLEPTLGKAFTIYSFDLPFHGMSNINEPLLTKGISKSDLKEFFTTFLAEKGASKFSLLGFSIGGKISLVMAELFSEKIESIFLFAPDGLHRSFWFYFITRTYAGRFIYRRLMKYPQRYLKITSALEKLHLISKRTSGFVKSALDSPEKRSAVFNTWMAVRYLNPDIRTIQDMINKYDITVYLFFGRYDRIIPPDSGKKFIRRLLQKNIVHVIESGHHLVKENMNKLLVSLSENKSE